MLLTKSTNVTADIATSKDTQGMLRILKALQASLWLLTTAELHVNSEHNPTLAQRQSFSVPAEPHTLAIMTTLANTANGLLC